ncbi:zinc ribbon domain-containing protein [Turicibacter sanguinis]|uniref:zinc ribbon domain-containing protein n=1 Tax=Turicibacter sanguinis TaxID=154288 RepID=UPI0021D48BB0|nr:zinc ribbon domain-containing protein [Turicibacter sanguinis]MCU7202492.1 zinc ribbon domain-containing protein [Turicibacter sanguinis]
MKWICKKCKTLNIKRANYCQACGEKKTVYVVPADRLGRTSFLMLNSYANSLRVLATGILLLGMLLIVDQIVKDENFLMASLIGFGMIISTILFLIVSEILDWMKQVEKENYQMAKNIEELMNMNQELLNWIKIKHYKK